MVSRWRVPELDARASVGGSPCPARGQTDERRQSSLLTIVSGVAEVSGRASHRGALTGQKDVEALHLVGSSDVATDRWCSHSPLILRWVAERSRHLPVVVLLSISS